jgi:hypothetical protein
MKKKVQDSREGGLRENVKAGSTPARRMAGSIPAPARRRTETILTVDLLSVDLKAKARKKAAKAFPDAGSGALSQWVRQLIRQAVEGSKV